MPRRHNNERMRGIMFDLEICLAFVEPYAPFLSMLPHAQNSVGIEFDVRAIRERDGLMSTNSRGVGALHRTVEIVVTRRAAQRSDCKKNRQGSFKDRIYNAPS